MRFRTGVAVRFRSKAAPRRIDSPRGRDNGRGIAVAQAAGRGCRLGLEIVNILTRQLERKPGGGIESASHDREHDCGFRSGGAEMTSPKSHKILVVEDEGLIAHDIALRLKALGDP